jgi:hypothetical protein
MGMGWELEREVGLPGPGGLDHAWNGGGATKAGDAARARIVLRRSIASPPKKFEILIRLCAYWHILHG